MDEGYIKFNCNWTKAGPVPKKQVNELNVWRDRLYELGLIGAYSNGIGFGNISIRFKDSTFIISGSATGTLESLNENHYVLVNDYDLSRNSLNCRGPVRASSESLSHAAVYESSPETNAVIHVHNPGMWDNLINKVPTTSENVPFGTPEMADEIKRLFDETSVSALKILVMGGHREGIIFFGATLDEAGRILLNYLPDPGRQRHVAI